MGECQNLYLDILLALEKDKEDLKSFVSLSIGGPTDRYTVAVKQVE